MNIGKIILNIAIALIVIPTILIGATRFVLELAGWISKIYKSLDIHEIRRRLSIVAILISLPFVVAGGAAWLSCDYPLTDLGSMVYILGFPLTVIVLNIDFFVDRIPPCDENLWVIPLISLLFIIQWVIWGQLLALLVRKIRDNQLGGEL